MIDGYFQMSDGTTQGLGGLDLDHPETVHTLRRWADGEDFEATLAGRNSGGRTTCRSVDIEAITFRRR